MNKSVLWCSLALLMLSGYAGLDPAEKPSAPPAQTAPDNTGRNVRHRGDTTLTPGDQSESVAIVPYLNKFGEQLWLTSRCRLWLGTSRLSRLMVSSHSVTQSRIPRKNRRLRRNPNKSQGEQR